MSSMDAVGPEETFLDECAEHLHFVESSLLDHPSSLDSETLNAVFRAFHSIKGAAEVFGYTHVGRFAHSVESLLGRVRDGKVQFSAEMGRILLACNDHVRHLLRLSQAQYEASAELLSATERISASLDSLQGGTASAASKASAGAAGSAKASDSHAASRATYKVRVECGESMFRRALDPLPVIDYLAERGTVSGMRCDASNLPGTAAFDPETAYLAFEFDFSTENGIAVIDEAFEFLRDDCTLTVAPLGDLPSAQALDFAEGATASLDQKPAGLARSFRVDASRIDDLVDLVGELVTAGAEIDQLAVTLRSEQLGESGHNLGRIIAEIRERTLRLRMVPVDLVFTRLRRTVYDVAAILGKEVHFEAHGGEIEFDRTLVERVTDPLVHIVRNSMDHGLESGDVREAAGKPRKGTIEMSAYNEAGDVVVEIRDDGAGLRKEKIMAKAVASGLTKPDAILTDAEIYNFIFLPGFSTAEKVTEVSGRGVGLDVVRRNIESLGGSVMIRTAEGKGTTFVVRLPLTLATIEGFMLGIGETRYVVSMDIVEACVEFVAETGRRFTEVRGDIIPFVDLRDLFKQGDASARGYLVIVRTASERIGLVVDRLFGAIQTVVKPLGALRGQTRGLSGFTVLGSGEVALILDVAAITGLAREQESSFKGESNTQVLEAHV